MPTDEDEFSAHGTPAWLWRDAEEDDDDTELDEPDTECYKCDGTGYYQEETGAWDGRKHTYKCFCRKGEA